MSPTHSSTTKTHPLHITRHLITSMSVAIHLATNAALHVSRPTANNAIMQSQQPCNPKQWTTIKLHILSPTIGGSIAGIRSKRNSRVGIHHESASLRIDLTMKLGTKSDCKPKYSLDCSCKLCEHDGGGICATAHRPKLRFSMPPQPLTNISPHTTRKAPKCLHAQPNVVPLLVTTASLAFNCEYSELV